ncbi:hypothetical protein S7711_05224 [Stachybotrys chartarum IBT 7711]|uniref:C2H2-type domain-containing protein n=1 Tax=Stachybotrys chartarum (strain CBS 109288 / IBT 7711) TaxID=1280523 RepID=A0A084ANJ1_STACB|nr:hypothetical protein S7711_05224 [Stachybotrys chartarum IBT 7711]KFA47776.1 hypothetical protein S40293_09037 [Stachybotrys chartarum IBT 40293]KFA76807.1 hypothetical protein S40288_03010 [Stachybotrys chartarum IBT 40288]
MPSPIPAEVMGITNMLNTKGNPMIPSQFNLDHQHSLIKPEPGMERSNSPHGSEHSHYSTQGMQRPYSTNAAMHAPMHISNGMHPGMHLPNFPDMHHMASVPNMSMQQMSLPTPQATQASQQPIQQPVKAYPCRTCGKGFARRSDLARHERIHSGHRPHVCDYPGCGKQFIQRSALTVHQRVHTGEKPHHCETCAKPFSDSSSLARHRRTHSGKRPYKCPYADCQKTFTRRTTLTRHQNHHSGTIEEAAAATAAALAASNKIKGVTQARSEGDHLSAHGSPMTTPSPGQRPLSMSPSFDLSGNSGMARHAGDFSYLSQTSPLPPHLRMGSPSSTSSAAYTNAMRPTSHPTSYGPPPILEPNLEQHQAGPGSASGSPHMSSVGWHSPSHVPSPSQNGANYVYPEPDTYPPNHNMSQMYFGGHHQMRRPGSAEPGLVHMA